MCNVACHVDTLATCRQPLAAQHQLLTLSGVSLETPLRTHPTQVICELILTTQGALSGKCRAKLQTCHVVHTTSSTERACESMGPLSQNDGVKWALKGCLIKNDQGQFCFVFVFFVLSHNIFGWRLKIGYPLKLSDLPALNSTHILFLMNDSSPSTSDIINILILLAKYHVQC